MSSEIDELVIERDDVPFGLENAQDRLIIRDCSSINYYLSKFDTISQAAAFTAISCGFAIFIIPSDGSTTHLLSNILFSISGVSIFLSIILYLLYNKLASSVDYTVITNDTLYIVPEEDDRDIREIDYSDIKDLKIEDNRVIIEKYDKNSYNIADKEFFSEIQDSVFM
jgi:hypothetical protein